MLLISENTRWRNQENRYEECEGSTKTCEKSVLNVFSNAQLLGSIDRNKKLCKNLKIKKGNIEYEFNQKYLKCKQRLFDGNAN